ncbi:MAG: CBS and ACT domain-containing protein [Proteobacteria bacterium]|nr:CBS and ACT domain-containing protein [Pseudomonadota bacterium]MBU4287401.1 CBS and ACT domain-containing protein [Pseudomonadota bacterium]MBU4413587.1 CBS and ACT domain-containing protein [Pseudomonadota bacterium]MCG2758178.1 CBS and ACT domain-containing protein [Desulfobacteraceae bacterium]
MLVKNWMSKPVITVGENYSMQDAINLLKQHNIRMLPVMGKGRVVGIISDRDLKKASASDVNISENHELIYSKIKIKDIMTENPISVPDDYTVEETAEVLLINKISGVPVINEQEKLVGIITQTDLFRVIFSLTGIGKKGIQFALKVFDRLRSIQQITDIIRSYGSRVSSILTSYERVPPGYRMVYIRIFNIDYPSLQSLIEEIRGQAELLYMIDHDKRKRYIYAQADTYDQAEQI